MSMSIQNEISRLRTAKAALKTAIEAKGVTVPEETTLDSYGGYVEQIPVDQTATLTYTIYEVCTLLCMDKDGNLVNGDDLSGTGSVEIKVPCLVTAAFGTPVGEAGHFTGAVTELELSTYYVTGDCDYHSGGVGGLDPIDPGDDDDDIIIL